MKTLLEKYNRQLKECLKFCQNPDIGNIRYMDSDFYRDLSELSKNITNILEIPEDELTVTITPDDVLLKYNGKEYFDDDMAIAYLIAREDIMIGGFLKPVTPQDDNLYRIYVLCNDTFRYSCADSEELPHNEIRNLFDMVVKDPIWGSTKWCILRRKEMPISRRLEQMKNDNAWDLDESILEENSWTKMWKEKSNKNA